MLKVANLALSQKHKGGITLKYIYISYLYHSSLKGEKQHYLLTYLFMYRLRIGKISVIKN